MPDVPVKSIVSEEASEMFPEAMIAKSLPLIVRLLPKVLRSILPLEFAIVPPPFGQLRFTVGAINLPGFVPGFRIIEQVFRLITAVLLLTELLAAIVTPSFSTID